MTIASRLDLPMTEVRLVALDVETTGLHPLEGDPGAGSSMTFPMPGGAPCVVKTTSVHRVIELGAVMFSCAHDRQEVYTSLFDPGRPIPADVVAVHGISDDDVVGAPRAAAELPRVLEILASADAVVGFNLPFDIRFLVHEAHIAGVACPELALLDLARLTPHIDLGRCALADLAWHMDVSVDEEHRALPDALTTARCAVELVRRLFPGGCSLRDVLGLSAMRTPLYTVAKARARLYDSYLERIAGDRRAWFQPLPKRICVTGGVEGFHRDDVIAALEVRGFSYVREVSGDVRFVVAGKRAARRKLAEASERGLRVVDGSAFAAWLRSDPADALPDWLG